jgi:hypothetical protein
MTYYVYIYIAYQEQDIGSNKWEYDQQNIAAHANNTPRDMHNVYAYIYMHIIDTYRYTCIYIEYIQPIHSTH